MNTFIVMPGSKPNTSNGETPTRRRTPKSTPSLLDNSIGGNSVSSSHSLTGSPNRLSGCPLATSPTSNIFAHLGKLDFSAALRGANATCACCRASNRMDIVDITSTKIPYITVLRPFNRYHANFSQELWESFGEDVVEKIFDEEGIQPHEVKCLANAGLNHEFIATSTKHLVKLIVPVGGLQASGEAHEMEFIRKNYPLISEDPSVCFPKKCFRLLTGGGHPPVYDAVALEYHAGAMSIREITQIFERAPMEEKQNMHAAMYSLVGEQVPRVLRNYQLRHLRKHGDGKADNILVTKSGSIVLCDIGSTFNDSLKPCDRDEYLRSLPTLDKQLTEMKRRFDDVFRCQQEIVPPTPNEEFNTSRRNIQLVKDVMRLKNTQKQGFHAPIGLFGPQLGGRRSPSQHGGNLLSTNFVQGGLLHGNRLSGMPGLGLLPHHHMSAPMDESQ